VDEKTRARLDAINHDFYDAFAEEFSATRDHPWAGWDRVTAAPGEGALRVLDVGCGNGRFATFLEERTPGPIVYLGVDANEVLLTQARRRPRGGRASLDFERYELLSARFRTEPPPGPYDLIVLFGVLHHVPSFEARRALLSLLGGLLAAGGRLVVTLWRFAEDERLQKRILPWRDYNARARHPIDRSQLEPGDHLLRWGAGGGAAAPPRYCHFHDDAETEELIRRVEGSGLGLSLSERFRADGKSGELNEYLVFERRAPGGTE